MNESKLRQWQIAPARQLLSIIQKYDSALDSSDTGTGKTYVALAIAQALQLPCLVVAPKIALSGWKSVAEYFNEPISIINYELLRTGRSQYGSWANQKQIDGNRPITFVCEFCQRRHSESELGIPCTAHHAGIHCVTCKPRPIRYGHFKYHPDVKLLIFDECHRAGGLKSLNAELVIAAKRQHIKTLLLSATPAQTILQMRAIGYSLGIFSL